MPELTFIPETHTYLLDGAEIPSVTQILKESGILDYRFVNQEVLHRAAKFGTAVHRATELWDRGRLNIATLDQALIPYLDAWRKFRDDFGFIPKLVEYRDYSRKYRFGFTLDRTGVCEKSVYAGKRLLVDLKTGIDLPGFRIQTGAYEGAHNELFKQDKIQIRICVLLGPNEYRIKEHKDKSDFSTFLACLQIVNFRRLHKIR